MRCVYFSKTHKIDGPAAEMFPCATYLALSVKRCCTPQFNMLKKDNRHMIVDITNIGSSLRLFGGSIIIVIKICPNFEVSVALRV